MIYDLKNELDRRRFELRLASLMAKGATVELTEKTYRSGSQNRYLHALLGALALETGNDLEYIKNEYYKRHINADIFVIERDDSLIGKSTTLRSSADLTREEMALSIDRLKRWAAQNAIYLPEAGDEELLKQIEYELIKNKRYL